MTQVGEVPAASTTLSPADIMGAIRVRLSINRMDYTVEPGLYAVGKPGESSPVLVSANYKLSFDWLRKELGGIDAWILVLDTKGVNVWCAAGKGTFGTDEVVNRVRAVNLDRVVSHRRLILPQLGAVGVAAHAVKKACGFTVVYGPVRACDIKAFLQAGMNATPEMRMVRFDMTDRIVVIPVELIQWFIWIMGLSFLMLAVSGIGLKGHNYAFVCSRGLPAVAIIMTAYLVGGIITPILLPWLPGRAFSMKGIWVGLAMWVLLLVSGCALVSGVTTVAFLFITGAITSFMAMNYTGTSTFTSQSGVRREMRIFVPLQITALVVGIVLWVVSGVINS